MREEVPFSKAFGSRFSRPIPMRFHKETVAHNDKKRPDVTRASPEDSWRLHVNSSVPAPANGI